MKFWLKSWKSSEVWSFWNPSHWNACPQFKLDIESYDARVYKILVPSLSLRQTTWVPFVVFNDFCTTFCPGVLHSQSTLSIGQEGRASIGEEAREVQYKKPTLLSYIYDNFLTRFAFHILRGVLPDDVEHVVHSLFKYVLFSGVSCLILAKPTYQLNVLGVWLRS